MTNKQQDTPLMVPCPRGAETEQLIERLSDYVKLPTHLIWAAVLAHGFEHIAERLGLTPLGYAARAEAARICSVASGEVDTMEGDEGPF